LRRIRIRIEGEIMSAAEELCSLPAADVIDLLKAGKVSPLELVDAAAVRVAEVEPKLNALPTLCFDRARERAKKLMAAPRGERPPNFLYGLPIAVKDNVDVAGVRCTHGSRVYERRISPTSDPVVERLEANGALVVAKSNLPEFAAGGNTFNDVFGVTRNPWHTAYTPGGSSGGSAAALAAGEVWLATGSDFGGSIRQPASHCSIVGLRPTPGRVPRVQKQAFSPLSVEGPLARNVLDCALMFDAEAGPHPLDPLSLGFAPEACAAAARAPRAPKRVAWSLDLGIAPAVDHEVATVCKRAMDALAQAGVKVEEAHPQLEDTARAFPVLRGAVFVGRFGGMLAEHRGTLKPEIVENTEFGLGLSVAEVLAAEATQGETIRRMAKFFERHDLLICPTVLCPPPRVEERYVAEVGGHALPGYMDWLIMTWAITVTACPVLALPCGFTASGLPVGLQVIAPRGAEAALFSFGAFIEDVFALKRAVPVDPQP
jgi:amidase